MSVQEIIQWFFIVSGIFAWLAFLLTALAAAHAKPDERLPVPEKAREKYRRLLAPLVQRAWADGYVRAASDFSKTVNHAYVASNAPTRSESFTNHAAEETFAAYLDGCVATCVAVEASGAKINKDEIARAVVHGQWLEVDANGKRHKHFITKGHGR